MELILKDSVVKTEIGHYLDDQLFTYYPASAIKAAGTPTRKELIEKIFADPQFQKSFTKYLLSYLDADLMSDAVNESIHDADIDDVFEQVADAYNHQNTIDHERQVQEENQKAIDLLKSRGYKVTM